jgi:glycosyltransferase involved in cell wall biosynthesis
MVNVSALKIHMNFTITPPTVTLTICIPTWNRKTQAIACLERAKKLLVIPNLDFLVIDNHSDDSIYVRIKEFESDRIRIVQNNTNIGADANYLRCIEFCNGDFCWLMGDDDDVSEDTINLVLVYLQQMQEDVLYIHSISNNKLVPDGLVLRNADDFLSKNITAEFAKLSCLIFRTKSAKTTLLEAYRGCGLLHTYLIVGLILTTRLNGCLCVNAHISHSVKSPRWNLINGVVGLEKSVMLALNGDLASRLSLRKFSGINAKEKGRSFILFCLIIGALDLQNEETINGLQFLGECTTFRRRLILKCLIFSLLFRPKSLFRLILQLLGQKKLLSDWAGSRELESGY